MKDTILVVDDEPNILSSIKRLLMDEPYEIAMATTAEDGLEILKHRAIKVVVSDECMPGMSGSEFLAIVKTRYPDVIRIILTGHASTEAAIRAVNNGEVYRFLTKPWQDYELILTLRKAIEQYNLQEENRRLLNLLKRQYIELELLRRRYPEITEIERDEEGNLLIDEDISEEEFQEIVARCMKEFS
ncbi:MAG TPA: response regulator [Nitrospirae bacterium]|nr:response regulator [Nitrospirota bacterium]